MYFSHFSQKKASHHLKRKYQIILSFRLINIIKYLNKSNKGLRWVQHDMTEACQQGKVEQVYIKRHQIILSFRFINIIKYFSKIEKYKQCFQTSLGDPLTKCKFSGLTLWNISRFWNVNKSSLSYLF
jgi:hypothetical protein